MTETLNDKIIIYQSEDGKTQLDVKLEGETVWLNTKQMAELFDKEESNIRRHVNNVFNEAELPRENILSKAMLSMRTFANIRLQNYAN